MNQPPSTRAVASRGSRRSDVGDGPPAGGSPSAAGAWTTGDRLRVRSSSSSTPIVPKKASGTIQPPWSPRPLPNRRNGPVDPGKATGSLARWLWLERVAGGVLVLGG